MVLKRDLQTAVYVTGERSNKFELLFDLYYCSYDSFMLHDKRISVIHHWCSPYSRALRQGNAGLQFTSSRSMMFS